MAKTFWIHLALISFFLVLMVDSKKGGKSKSGSRSSGSNRSPSHPGNTGMNPSHTGNTGGSWNPGHTGNTGGGWNPGHTGNTGGGWNPGQTGNTGGGWNPGQTGNTGGGWNPGHTGNTGGGWNPGHTGNTGGGWNPSHTGNTGGGWNPSHTGNTGGGWNPHYPANPGSNRNNYYPGGSDYNKQFKPPKSKTNMKMVAGAAAVGAVSGFALGSVVSNMKYRFDNDMDARYYNSYQNQMPNRIYRPQYQDNPYVPEDKFVSDCVNISMTEYVFKPNEGKNASEIDETEVRVKSTIIRKLCVVEYRTGTEYYPGSGLNLLFSPSLILFITLFVYFVVE